MNKLIIKQKKILVIAGPTGVGESTITKKIIKKYPIFKKLVTATTRKPRLNEKNKIDYYFFTKKKFKEEIDKKNITEYTYVKSRDVYYGSYKLDLNKKLKKGFNIIVNPDIVGAKFYKKYFNATTIFITADSLKDIEKRLVSRDSKISKIELKKRMANAKLEIENEAYFYDYIIKNRQGKIRETINKIEKIIKNKKYKLKK